MRSGQGLFTSDFKAEPYWWDETPPAEIEARTPPNKIDVVVIGSGYTGLHAALQTARGGRSTLVLDAGPIGFGCSTRNGGQISSSIKPDFSTLAKSHGEANARAILAEGEKSLAWVGDFIRSEAIDCDFRVSGRFHGAHSARQYEALTKRYAGDTTARLIPHAEQPREIGTDAYYGGVLFRKHAALDPARYHRGLLERTRAAGAIVVPNCAATRVEAHGPRFRVTTTRGAVVARDVIIGTNGYTGRSTQWLRRRIIPIGSYIIATEPIAHAVMAKILPTDRMITDSRKVVYYYRASPDRTRILFGGRVSWNETDPRVSAPLLKAELARIFPALAEVRVSHSWMGFVGFTFDTLMHTGRWEGMHYAAGYCGSGVGMASYLGMKLGLKVLGNREGGTAFDDLPFPSRAYYSGYPWFLAAAIRFYRWRDQRS